MIINHEYDKKYYFYDSIIYFENFSSLVLYYIRSNVKINLKLLADIL